MSTTGVKLTWPGYQDMSIKTIEEMADAFAAWIKEALGLESEHELTAEGIVLYVDAVELNQALKDLPDPLGDWHGRNE
jgi:hypothetical protein